MKASWKMSRKRNKKAENSCKRIKQRNEKDEKEEEISMEEEEVENIRRKQMTRRNRLRKHKGGDRKWSK